MLEERPKAVVLLLCTAVLWSTGGLLIKWIDWHPMAIASMRSAIAAAFLLLVLRRPRFTWSGVQIGGGIAYACCMLGFVAATKLTTAANAILLVYTAPIYVALWSAWFLQERVTTLDWVTILLVLGGMGLFFLERLTVAGFWGNVCAIGGGMAFAWVVLCLRKQKGTSVLETVVLGNLIAALVGLPFMFHGLPSVSSCMALVLSGTLQIGLAFILYAIAIRSVSALEAILIPMIEPLLNPLWVFLLLGETPSFWAVVGGIIVVASVTVRGLLHASRLAAASQPGAVRPPQQPHVLPS